MIPKLSPAAAAAPLARAEETRHEILRQHRLLRVQIASIRDVLRVAREDRAMAGVLLRQLLEGIRAVIEHHLAYEEGAIVPHLLDDPPLGPLRAAALVREHARQRDELYDLARAAEHEAPTAFADRLDTLLRDLLVDMADEEQTLLSSDVLRDDRVVVDQNAG